MSTASAPEPAIVLLNPAAGQGRADGLRRPMAHWLLKHAPGVPLLAPQSADAALATLMITANRTRVVLVGGDGTVHAMLPAFLRCGHRLGLVPAGQRNRLAQSLGVADVPWQQALAYALTGRTAPIDVAQLQTESQSVPFISQLTVGWEAVAAQHAAEAPRWLGPSARAWWGTVGAGRQSPPTEARLWVDGRLEHEGRLLSARLHKIVSTADGTARLGDGRLTAEVVDTAAPWRRAALLRATPVAARRWPGHKVLVDANRPLAVLVDGEPQPPSARFTVQMLTRAVQAVGLHGTQPAIPARLDPPRTTAAAQAEATSAVAS